MKRILKSIFLIIALVFVIFWTIGWFSVPKEEHKLILIACAVSEIIPIALWRIMDVLIRRDERRKESSNTESVPIWERDKKETDLTTKDDTGKNASENATDKASDDGEKAVADSNTNDSNANTEPSPDSPDSLTPPDSPASPDNLPRETEAEKTKKAEKNAPAPEKENVDGKIADVVQDTEGFCRQKTELLGNTVRTTTETDEFTVTESVTTVPDQPKELREYVDRAVSEASVILGVLSALRVARASFQVTKAVLTMLALSCQDYETDHPMYGVLLPMETGDFEDINTVFTIRQKVEEYLLSTGKQDVYAELYGILIGFATTSCSSTTYKPFLKQWLEQNGDGHGHSPFPEVRRLVSNRGSGVGLVYILKNCLGGVIPF